MVDAGSAVVGGSDDTTGVGLPEGGINADGHWTLLDLAVHVDFLGRRLRDDVVAGRLGVLGDISLVEIASASSLGRARGVRVVLEELDATSTLDVAVSIDRIAAVATIVHGVATDNLLRGKSVQNSSGQEGVRFNLFCGTECPARAALALVLHGSDGTLETPVNVCGLCGRVELLDEAGIVDTTEAGAVVHLLELVRVDVGELVDCVDVLAAIAVALLDQGKVLLEDVEATLDFSLVVVGLAIRLNEFLELSVVSILLNAEAAGNCGGSKNESELHDDKVSKREKGRRRDEKYNKIKQRQLFPTHR